jgi:hypothetical protein
LLKRMTFLFADKNAWNCPTSARAAAAGAG